MRHFFCTAFLFLMMCACGCSFALAGPALNVTVGHTFDIELETNPSTGYSWNPVFQSDYLSLKSRMVEPGPGKLLGAPEKERFTFTALKSGVCEIEFRYSRSWEKESVKTENFRVNIRP